MHAADGQARSRSRNAGHSRARKLLVVDDHTEVRESLGDLLEAAGFGVVRADGGRSALDYLLKEQAAEAPDVILLDFAMGDMTGADFLAEKAMWPSIAQIPVVFVTADSRARATAAAADCECLGKPLDLDDLLAALERQTSRRRHSPDHPLGRAR